MINNLNHYINCFSSLNTMKKMGKPAPHKALLLLSVIDLVERGIITDCRVLLSDSLEKQFKHNTTRLLGESILFQPKISYPYYHMRSEHSITGNTYFSGIYNIAYSVLILKHICKNIKMPKASTRYKAE